MIEEDPESLGLADRGRSTRPRPAEDQGPNLSTKMQRVIENTIERGNASGLSRKLQTSKNSTAKPTLKPTQSGQVQRPPSPGTSIATEESILEEDNIGEQELSEDETPIPDKPAFTGLFRPSLFKAILHKVKASTQEGTPSQGTAVPSGTQDPKEGLFKENAPAQDLVPMPELFVNVVQRQWAQPGHYPTISLMSNCPAGSRPRTRGQRKPATRHTRQLPGLSKLPHHLHSLLGPRCFG